MESIVNLVHSIITITSFSYEERGINKIERRYR